MTVAVTCPECLDRYEVSDQAAAQMIRCRRCQCPIEPKHRAEGIQAGAPAAAPLADEDELPRGRRRRPSEPRSPFPWTALWIVAFGLVFFLLAFSVGFNVWLVGHGEDPFRVQQERMRADMEAQMRQQAQQEAEKARASERDAKRGQELLRQELEEVHRELTRTKQELDAARRAPKQP